MLGFDNGHLGLLNPHFQNRRKPAAFGEPWLYSLQNAKASFAFYLFAQALPSQIYINNYAVVFKAR